MTPVCLHITKQNQSIVGQMAPPFLKMDLSDQKDKNKCCFCQCANCHVCILMLFRHEQTFLVSVLASGGPPKVYFIRDDFRYDTDSKNLEMQADLYRS